MKFINGLRPEIRSTVFLQHPKDLDTAYCLASLQEEVLDPSRAREVKKFGYSSFPAAAIKGAHPLPPPPLYDKAKPTTTTVTVNSVSSPVKSQTEIEKLAALKAYRRVMGQCFKCGDKWAHNHKCDPTVQLHAVQEIWDMFQSTLEEPDSPDRTELCMAFSPEAFSGQVTPKTFKLYGSVQGHEVVILVDSSSTHTFISTTLAS